MKKALISLVLLFFVFTSLFAGSFTIGLKPGYLSKSYSAIRLRENEADYYGTISQLSTKGIAAELYGLYCFTPKDEQRVINLGIAMELGFGYPLGAKMTILNFHPAVQLENTMCFDGFAAFNFGIKPNELMGINLFVGPEIGYDKVYVASGNEELIKKFSEYLPSGNSFSFGIGFGVSLGLRLTKLFELELGCRLSQNIYHGKLYQWDEIDREKMSRSFVYLGTLFHL